VPEKLGRHSRQKLFLLVLQFHQFVPDLLHMPLDLDFRPDKGNISLGINKIRTANYPIILPTGHFLQLPDPVCLQRLMLRITEQGYSQLFFGNEVAMAFGGVWAGTDNGRVHFFKFVYQTGKPLGFFGSARGIILGIEEENHPLPLKIHQADGRVILIRQAENGSLITKLQHRQNPPLNHPKLSIPLILQFLFKNFMGLPIPIGKNLILLSTFYTIERNYAAHLYEVYCGEQNRDCPRLLV